MTKRWHYRATIYSNKKTVIITDPISCKGNVLRSIFSDTNNATFTFTNLAPSTRSKIYQDPLINFSVESFKFIRFECGYSENNDDSTMTEIFFGRILQATSQKAGGAVDITTTIEATAMDLFNQTSKTFAAGTSYKDAIKIMAGDMPNVKLGNIGTIEGEFKTDTTFDGNTIEQINKIAGGGAFIDNGVLNVCGLNECVYVPVPVISSDKNLLGTPIRRDANLEIKFMMLPELIVGQLLEVNSSTFTDFNGQYKVIGLTHDFLFSESEAGQRTTTANLFLTPFLPIPDMSITGDVQQTNFSTVKGEYVTPVLNSTPTSVQEVYNYIQKNNGALPRSQITKNIWWHEMIGNDNTNADIKKEVTRAVLTNCYVIATKVQEKIDLYYSGATIKINSGWRSVANNRNCGGAANSKHLYGLAIDFKLQGYSTQQVFARAFNQTAAGWGWGYSYWSYKDFIHIQINGNIGRVNDV